MMATHMVKTLQIVGAFALVALLQGCAKDAPTSSTDTASSSAATGPGTPKDTNNGGAAPGTINGFGVPVAANKCPSAAPGSTTTVNETAEGVEITVTAPGGAPINDIRQRGVQIIAAQKDTAAMAGADLAKCPIIAKDSVITETDVPGGAKFLVKPANAANLDQLKKDTKSRATGYTPETK